MGLKGINRQKVKTQKFFSVALTCSGPMEDSPDVGTEVTEVMLICPVIWFMLLKPPVLVAMDTLMFMLLLYMLVFACCPKCGGDCCENMLEHREKVSEPGGKPRQQSGALVLE